MLLLLKVEQRSSAAGGCRCTFIPAEPQCTHDVTTRHADTVGASTVTTAAAGSAGARSTTHKFKLSASPTIPAGSAVGISQKSTLHKVCMFCIVVSCGASICFNSRCLIQIHLCTHTYCDFWIWTTERKKERMIYMHALINGPQAPSNFQSFILCLSD